MLQGILPDDSPASDTYWHQQLRRDVPLRMAGPVELPDELDVQYAVHGQKNGKAPGDDGIRPEILKRGYTRLQLLLLDAVRTIWQQGIFPDQWKHGVVKLFLKSPNRDRTAIQSYRPITLLPVLGKVVERLICQRLVMFLDSTQYFGDNQYGFRAGRGTVDAMLDLKRTVSTADRPYVMGIFLDISGAFDNAWWPFILWQLRNAGCPADLYNLIHSYLMNRTATLSWDGVTATKNLTKGCPQGSILGPVLWNVVFETFLRHDFGADVRIIAYADDAVIVVPGTTHLDLEEKAAVVMGIMDNWSVTSKLEFSATKSQLMMLKGRFDHARQPRVFYRGTRLQKVNRHTYLGVVVDEGLHFSTHVAELAGRVTSTFFALSSLARENHGYSCAALRKLYKGVAQPLLTYGCEFWGTAITLRRQYARKLLSVQRRLLLLVNKAYKTISHDANTVIAGIVPIDLLIAERIAISNDVTNGIPRHVSKPARRQETMTAWNDRWRTSIKGRETFAYFPTVEYRLRLLKVNWSHYTTQYLSGHGNFRSKLHGFRLQPEPWCPHCGEGTEETSWHCLAECPEYDIERRELREIWTNVPIENRRIHAVSSLENFALLNATARAIGKKKERARIRE